MTLKEEKINLKDLIKTLKEKSKREIMTLKLLKTVNSLTKLILRLIELYLLLNFFLLFTLKKHKT